MARSGLHLLARLWGWIGLDWIGDDDRPLGLSWSYMLGLDMGVMEAEISRSYDSASSKFKGSVQCSHHLLRCKHDGFCHRFLHKK